jgi:general secretion pathway protein A
MYLAHWELKQRPFDNLLDTKFAFFSEQYREAIARLVYAIKEAKGGAVLYGEYGSGKSLVRSLLMERLKELDQFHPIVITHPNLPTSELYALILTELQEEGTPPPLHLTRYLLLREIRDRLHCIGEQGRSTVLIVDEAQSIRDDQALEDIRMLLNIHEESQNAPLILILIGQQSLIDRLANIPPLLQRLPVRWRLMPLDASQTAQYIAHRLRAAGGRADLFTPEAIEAVHAQSGGIPRVINNICDLALLAGFMQGATAISLDVVKNAIQELQISEPTSLGS